MTAKNKIAQSAIRTMEIETGGLKALASAFENGLAGAFSDTVSKLAEISGRVIVTGMGKSGHIGAKMAATFASTGTPAYFVHPAEANHGDLGMITRQDAVIAMSWSGESAELKGIVAYTRRFSIPLIAITANENSTLGRESDICLTLPKVPEACPHNLAPTTSSLMQLALGDALAIALLEARDFSESDFKTFHPGGSLGASLTHVAEVMHAGDDVPLIAEGADIRSAVEVISRKGFGCVGVVSANGTLVGVVTDGDLRRNIMRNMLELTVDEIMTRSPRTVAPETLAIKAMAILNERSITSLLVVADDKPVGIIHMHDLLRIGVA